MYGLWKWHKKMHLEQGYPHGGEMRIYFIGLHSPDLLEQL